MLDMMDPALANEPMLRKLAKEPMDPIESVDPTEPIESTELRDPMLRIEWVEPMLQREWRSVTASSSRDMCALLSQGRFEVTRVRFGDEDDGSAVRQGTGKRE